VLSLLVAGVLAGLATLNGAPGWVVVTAGTLDAVAPQALNTGRARPEDRRKDQSRIRALTSGATRMVRDVAAQVGVHRPVRDDLPYIVRDVEQEASDRLRMERRLLIVSPLMLGKTRLALSVAKAAFGDYIIDRGILFAKRVEPARSRSGSPLV
jgi:hypothetical protein